MNISITDSFDGGNIELATGSSAELVRLKIKKDSQSNFLQWFYFRATGTEKKHFLQRWQAKLHAKSRIQRGTLCLLCALLYGASSPTHCLISTVAPG